MIIGLAGKAGVGKTTIAKMMEERGGFVIRTYAYPLKKSMVALTGLPMDYFTDIKLKEEVVPWIGKSPRQLMQTFGTDYVRRMVSKDFWIDRMHETLSRMDSSVNVVIDDCRFENETALVRSMGGMVVHLMRDYDCPTAFINHESEQTLMVEPDDMVIRSGKAGPDYTFKEVMGESYAYL